MKNSDGAVVESRRSRVFYGWVVVATFLAAGTVLWGIRLSFGVFFKSLEAEFSLSRAATSSIFSIYMLLGSFLAWAGGWALDRFGPKKVIFIMGFITGTSMLLTSRTTALWQVYLTYSLLLAVGSGGIFVVAMSTVSRWFDKRRGTALGIASSGVGTGTMLMSPYVGFLIAQFGWRSACILAGLTIWVVAIPLSFFLKREPGEVGALPDGAAIQVNKENHIAPPQVTGLSLGQALRTRSMWAIIVVWFLFGTSVLLITAHLVPHVTDIGYFGVEAATILSFIGVANVIGRISMGMVSDRGGRRLSAMVCGVLQALAMLMLLWAKDLWVFYLFGLIFGFAYGGLTSGVTALVSNSFGLKRIGTILGALDVGFGTGAAVGPVIGGIIFDKFQSYSWAFIAASGAMLAAAGTIMLIRKEIRPENTAG